MWRHGARGRLGTPHGRLGRLCVCEEGLEGVEHGGPVDLLALCVISGLLIPLEDSEVRLATHHQAYDGHGVGMDLALCADAPSMANLGSAAA